MDQTLKSRLKELLLEKSYEKRDVVLASGQKSDFYFDGKQTSLHPEGAYLLGEIFLTMIQSLPVKIAAVGGPTLGADPLVTAVSLTSFLKKAPIPAFIIRKEPKKHGTGQWLEGIKNLKSGDRIVVLEDVVTSGKSSLDAVSRAREFGLDVYGILAVIDREQGGAAAIQAAGLAFDSIFTKTTLLQN
jgi:orotate phosphoribosyltransferase